MCPYLLALHPNERPDSDKLLYAALLLNDFQIKCRVIKQSSESKMRTHGDICDIDKVTLKTGVALADALSLSIHNKIRRMMYYAGENLRSIGCSRLRENYDCEKLHKASKASYHATNKNIMVISAQIFSILVLHIWDCSMMLRYQLSSKLESLHIYDILGAHSQEHVSFGCLCLKLECLSVEIV